MADKIISETNKLVREGIKKTAVDKVKLIALYHHYSMIGLSENHYDKEVNKRDYHYFLKQKALFTSALEIYKGSLAFNRNAIKNIEEFFTADELKDPSFDTVTSTPAQNVWFNILQKIEIIKAVITPEDTEILKHLEHIDIVKSEDTLNYKIEFTFGKNEHIMNDKLTVEVFVNENSSEGEEERYNEIKSTEIKWYPGKDIRFHEVTVKPKGKKGKKGPAKTKLERKDSFFWIFKDHKKPELDEDEEEEEDEDKIDECSDDNLFYIASDVLSCFERDVYELSIPALFGIEIEIFKLDQGFGEEEGGVNPSAIKTDGTKPECKQQ